MQVAAVALVVSTFLASQANHPALIPTSDVVDIARAIARDEGFPVRDTTRYYVDLLQTVNGHPRLAGFLSAAVYGKNQIVLEVSINETTGQVVDATRCVSYEFPDVMKFGARVRAATGARPLTRAELSNVAGCELKIVRVPRFAKP